MDDQIGSFVCVYITLMLMSLTQHLILQPGHQETTSIATRRQRHQPPIPYNRIAWFTVVGMHDIICYHLMRFTPAEILRILPLLALQEIRFRNRLEVTPEEALAVILIRLSYPTRYWSMMDRFGYSRTWLSIIFSNTLIHLYRRYRKKLAWDEARLKFLQLSIYAQTIYKLGGGSCFWSFIDGTLNATSRPIVDQEQFYSGHLCKFIAYKRREYG